MTLAERIYIVRKEKGVSFSTIGFLLGVDVDTVKNTYYTYETKLKQKHQLDKNAAIDELNVPQRIINALKRNHILTIGQFLALTPDDIENKKMRGIADGSIRIMLRCWRSLTTVLDQE